jgi:hypothetical protein
MANKFHQNENSLVVEIGVGKKGITINICELFKMKQCGKKLIEF